MARIPGLSGRFAQWRLCLSVGAIVCLSSASAQQQSVSPGAIQREFETPAAPLSREGPQLSAPFSPGAPDGAAAVRFVLNDIEIEGADAVPAETLKALAAPLIGKETSIAEIYETTVRMTREYSDRGYPLAVAIIPVQEINGGVVRIKIVEGYVAEVEIAGDAGPARDFLERIGQKLAREKPLTSKALERYLLLANDAPGLDVTAVFDRASVGDGGVKVILKAARKPFDAAVGVNNRGSRALGRLRAVASLAENGLLSGTERISADIVQAFDGSELTFVRANASRIVTAEGLELSLGGNWSTSEPGTALLQSLEFNSDGWSIDIGAAYPLIRARSKNLRAFASFEASNLKSRFGVIDNTDDKLRVLSVGAAFDMQDRFGGLTSATATLRKGIGALGATREGDPLKSRVGGDGSYVALLAGATRRQALGETFEAALSVNGQIASRQLLSSEQCGFGGANFGRGFDNFEIAGDSCVLGAAELRMNLAASPAVSIQPYAYYDAGVVWRRGAAAPGEDRRSTGQSVGGGLRAFLDERVAASVEYAQPLARDVALEGDGDGRVFFSITLAH